MSDEVGEALARLDEVTREAEALAADVEKNSSTALVPVGSNVPATAIKEQMARKRGELVRMQKQVEAARKQVEAALQAKMSEARAVLAPLQKQVALLVEGLETVNLYLGRDEELVVLRDGERAPAEEPICVRQMVLSMDQEHALSASEGGLDARDVATFDQWLLEDEAHLQQVIPERRGVVVLVPRRTPKDYGDPWVSRAMQERNLHSYWLIRNGDYLVRMDTEFDVGTHVIPEQHEFTSFFSERRYNHELRAYETVPIRPGSREWEEASEKADARRRHYMRVALILQGLLDRTTVFHPLPAPTVSLLNEESYDAGHVRVITDAEQALTTGRKPFYEWLADLNSHLRAGMRIMGAFDTEEWRELQGYDYSGRYNGRHTRLSPGEAAAPETGEIYRIEGRRSGKLYFLYKRSDKRHGWEHGDWGDWGAWEYKKRASCEIDPGDKFILPFDLVTVPELRTYMEARLERSEYLSLIPLMKAAIAAKEAEQAEEAPFRELLRGEILKANEVDIDDETLEELVQWWKVGNRWHRALVGMERDEQAKAVRMIVKEERLRRTGKVDDNEAEAVAAIRHRLDPMFIARKRTGEYVAFVPANDDNVFLHRHIFKGRRDLFEVGDLTEWILPGMGWKRWRVLWTNDRWAAWDHGATLVDHLTEPERNDLIAKVGTTVIEARLDKDPEEGIGQLWAVSYDERKRKFQVFFWPENGEWEAPEHLLTEDVVAPTYAKHDAHWRRGPNGRLEWVIGRYTNHERWDRHSKLPWGEGERGPKLVWEDAAVTAEATKVQTAYLEALKLTGEMSSEVHTMHHAIAEQWKEAATAMHYARFIEDFLDPELWEGHAKTLKIDYPYWRARFDEPAPLIRVLDQLIERGLHVYGMTVREAVDLHAGLGLPPYESRWSGGLTLTHEVPDELMHYRFPALQEKFEDDDEEDWYDDEE